MVLANGKRPVLILISIIAAILFLESVLRLAGVFGPPSLFLKSHQDGRRILALNPAYISEFSSLKNIDMQIETTVYNRQIHSDVYRIFFLGHDILGEANAEADVFLDRLSRHYAAFTYCPHDFSW